MFCIYVWNYVANSCNNNQTIADDRGRCGIDNETFYSDDVFDDEFSNKLFIL